MSTEEPQPEQPVSATTTDTAIEMDTEAPKTEDAAAVASSQGATEEDHTEKKQNGLRFDENGVLKTSAQEDPSRRNNSRYDPSVLPENDDPQTIRNQVEFYFGDSNLPQDNFLWNATDGANNLPVKIDKICSFGRMKRYKSVPKVVAALRESTFLEVTGPEGLEEVKRKVPYDPTLKDKSLPRSVYVKGFGDEEPSSQFDIEAFFTPYGPLRSVRLRRTPDKLFKGSVFVEFQDEDIAEAFLKLEPQPKWKGEHALKIMRKQLYVEGKNEDIRGGKIQPGPTQSYRGRGRGRGERGERGGYRNNRNDRGQGRDRGDRDPDDWKKRRDDDRANGFKDDRNGRDNKGGRGRGRGRGRDARNNDRNRDREDRDKNGDESEKKTEVKSKVKPEVAAENPQTESTKPATDGNGEVGTAVKQGETKSEAPEVENNKKRAREDDGEAGTAPKKVDSKADVTVESS